MSTVRWGIVGAGRIAHSFARDIAGLDNAELVAVAARDHARAQAFSRQYSIEQAYGDYGALYARPDLDAVYVATPHSFHLQNCKDALTAGKAVLCEKPLVLNPAECEELIAHARTTGAYLMEGMWTWFLPAIRKAQQWVAEGRIGSILHVKSDFGYPFEYSEDRREYDARLGGGCVLEMGVYPIAMARLFLRRAPRTFQVTGHLAPNGVEDDMSAVLDYGDAMASLGSSFRCKLPNWTYVVGTEGHIAIPDFWRAEQCSLHRLDEQIEHFSDGRATLGFNYQIESVSGDILAGKRESATVPLSQSLALQQDMATIRALARHTQNLSDSLTP